MTARNPKLVKAASGGAIALTVTTSALDIGNTWTANNDNTNKQRLQKTGIQVAGIAAGFGVGYLAVAVANAWNPAGWGMLAAAGIVIGGGYAINAVQKYYFRRLSIDD